MAKFKRGQIVKSDGNKDVTYKVKTLHRDGDITITVHTPAHSRGCDYRIVHGPSFDRFTVIG